MQTVFLGRRPSRWNLRSNKSIVHPLSIGSILAQPLEGEKEEDPLLKNLQNRHFDLIAFAYDRLLGPPHADDLKELLRLPTRGRLLDAGGGTGRASLPLRPHVDGVVVADLSWILADKPA